MSVDRERLVDLITGRVMEELRRSAAAGGTPAPAPPISHPAPVSADGDAETQERMRLFNVTGARTPEETRTLHEAGASSMAATSRMHPTA